MSDSYRSVVQEVPSGRILSSGVCSDYEDPETAEALKPFLSRERLESLCGSSNLSHVTSLELCVNTVHDSLGDLGALLPRLLQLKLNNSVITSVRDLGSNLSSLQVLWMSHCCLEDLNGISAFSSLKELYVAYNNVSNLVQVGMLENLQLLDLEANNVDDLTEIMCLSLCAKLQSLTLEGNPVCLRPKATGTQMADYNYRASVRELVPQLRCLDNIKVEEDAFSLCNTTEEDWDFLRSPAASSDLFELLDDSATGASCVNRLSSPDSNTRSRLRTPIRPATLSTSEMFPGFSNWETAALQGETSTILHGAGRVLFCGNPVRALKARQKRLMTAPTKSSCDKPIHIPEHTYDTDEPDLGERGDVLAELKAWRKQHNRLLQAIEKDRGPQVLIIQHEEEGKANVVEDDEFEQFTVNTRDEEGAEDDDNNIPTKNSLHPPSQSLFPDLLREHSLSPIMTQLSPSSRTPVYPSPPSTAAPTRSRLPSVRARRVCLIQDGSESVAPKTEAMTNRTLLSLSCPPVKSDLDNRSLDSRLHPTNPLIQDFKQKSTKILPRPIISRPHTARAVLQKHHRDPLSPIFRGSLHLN